MAGWSIMSEYERAVADILFPETKDTWVPFQYMPAIDEYIKGDKTKARRMAKKLRENK